MQEMKKRRAEREAAKAAKAEMEKQPLADMLVPQLDLYDGTECNPHDNLDGTPFRRPERGTY
jgi:hypothetical protein